MIETTITKIQYDADGVQRRWSIPFPYADAKHISIYTKVGEEPTVKVVDNYDIDEDDSVVIYPTVASGQEPVAAGTKIIIARETPETQLEDASQVHFTSKDVERGLDKLTMITQELSTTASETMEVSADAFEAAKEAVNSAAQANETAEEAKTIAGQAVGIATDAKSIAEGIDAKATQSLNNSNTAINTANSAKETAENIDGKATQALTNSNIAVSTANSAKQTAEGVDSKATQALSNSTIALEKATEAKNTADSYQGQITTIESKIPDDATEQNKLVTKTQMETAVAGSSGFDFEGTKAEFDAAVAAGTITEDSVSLITNDVSGDNVATKAELQAVDSSKANTALSNVLANIDYVVESKFPTADDPTWFRKYKSGWLEQGGYFGNPQTIGTNEFTITFLKNYTIPPTVIFGNMSTRNQAAYDSEHYPYDVTISYFKHKNTQPQGQGTRWYAFGMGAN